jgi:hypothetical protein
VFLLAGSAAAALVLEREHAESWHAAEVTIVSCGDAEAVGKRRRRDPEIVAADDRSSSGEKRPDLSVHACHLVRNRHCFELREQVFDERTAPRASPAARAVDAVKQLADGEVRR